MSEETIIRHCSPTLAGLKTGSVFSCPCESDREMKSFIRDMNRRLSAKGLRFLPLKISDKKALIYVYRPVRLKKDLSHAEAGILLKRCGYTCAHPERCIVRLARRLQQSDDFPHEIGLFLGYPPEDVRGFIDNNAKRCKYTGLWKVYGDVTAARRIFAQYRKCTELYLRQMTKGNPIEHLAVRI